LLEELLQWSDIAGEARNARHVVPLFEPEFTALTHADIFPTELSMAGKTCEREQ
jgi:hypothetical protein